VSQRVRNVGEYLDRLAKSGKGMEPQVREGLETYVELWRKAIAKGVVSAEDGVDDALAKLEEAGGLYEAAGD
jgi:hypothetical protein